MKPYRAVLKFKNRTDVKKAKLLLENFNFVPSVGDLSISVKVRIWKEQEQVQRIAELYDAEIE